MTSEVIPIGSIVYYSSSDTQFSCEIIDYKKKDYVSTYTLRCISTDNRLRIRDLVNNLGDLRKVNKNIARQIFSEAVVPKDFVFFISDYLIFENKKVAHPASNNSCKFYVFHRYEGDAYKSAYEKLFEILNVSR